MKNINLVRIDDRLIHGQVMTAWMKVMPAKKIIIIDNKVAADDFMISILELAAPSGVKVQVLNEERALKELKEEQKMPTFILVKTPLTLKPLLDAGIPFEKINIGGMGLNADRKSLYKNISATDEERKVLKEFLNRGIETSIQIIPAEKVIEIKNLL